MGQHFLVKGKGWAKVYEATLDFDAFCEWVRANLAPAEKNVHVFQLELVTRRMDEVPFLLSGSKEENPDVSPGQSAPCQNQSNDDDWS